MRFIIIGAGGVGGWLAMGLAATIQYTEEIDPKVLIIIDGDNFEEKNKERQHFMNMGNKAEVRAAELSHLYPDVFIVPDPRYVVAEMPAKTSEDDPENTKVINVDHPDLFKDGDVIFTAVDNEKCRADVLTEVMKRDNIDVFFPGNGDISEGDPYFGSLYHYQRRDGADTTYNPREFKDEFVNPKSRNPGEMSCEERARIEGGTQLIWTNMAVAAFTGALVNQAVIEVLKGEKKEEVNLPKWQEVMFDLAKGKALPTNQIVIDEAADTEAVESEKSLA